MSPETHALILSSLAAIIQHGPQPNVRVTFMPQSLRMTVRVEGQVGINLSPRDALTAAEELFKGGLCEGQGIQALSGFLADVASAHLTNTTLNTTQCQDDGPDTYAWENVELGIASGVFDFMKELAEELNR